MAKERFLEQMIPHLNFKGANRRYENKRKEGMHKGLEVSGNMADLETNKSFAWME
jgi:hypothetical protein